MVDLNYHFTVSIEDALSCISTSDTIFKALSNSLALNELRYIDTWLFILLIRTTICISDDDIL